MNRPFFQYISRYSLYLVLLTPVPGYSCFEESLRTQSFTVQGNATTMDGELVYTETLTQTPDSSGGKLDVDYKNPEGKLIARKTVKYDCNPTTPSFTLEDTLTGKSEGVRWNDSDLESFQGDKITRMDHPSDPAAVDSGFDNVIKLNWETLMNKGSVKYDYLFARKNKFLKLRFSLSEPPKPLRDKAGDNIAFFKVGANNLIFRMLSSPIYVGYDIQSKSLAYYYGPTNLPMFDMEEPLLITYQPG